MREEMFGNGQELFQHGHLDVDEPFEELLFVDRRPPTDIDHVQASFVDDGEENFHIATIEVAGLLFGILTKLENRKREGFGKKRLPVDELVDKNGFYERKLPFISQQNKSEKW